MARSCRRRHRRQLCRRLALPVAARRRVYVLLRLVLRPAAGQPDDLGRADRRAGKRRLVQCRLSDALGLERSADAHARRAFLHRGPLQGHQERRRSRPTTPRRPSSPISGCIPKQGTDAALAMAMGHVILQGVPPRPQRAVFRRLRAPLHRHADAGAAGAAQRRAYVPERLLRAADFDDGSARPTTRNGRRSRSTRRPATVVRRTARSASAGASKGKWNLQPRNATARRAAAG